MLVGLKRTNIFFKDWE